MVTMRFRPAGRNPWRLPWEKKRNKKIDEAAMKIATGLPAREQAEIKKLAEVLSNEGDGGIWEALDEKNSLIVAEALYRNGVRAR